jgi:hypothetical protein
MGGVGLQTLLANVMRRRIGAKARAGASPAPTMTRLGRPVRVMVGVPLAGTLARHCTPCVIRQQSPSWSPASPAMLLPDGVREKQKGTTGDHEGPPFPAPPPSPLRMLMSFSSVDAYLGR